MAKKISMGATLSLKDGNFFTNMKSATSAANGLKGTLANATSAVKSHGSAASAVGGKLKRLIGIVGGVVAAYASVSAIKKFGDECLTAANNATEANTRLNTIMKQIPGNTDKMTASVAAYATKLSKTTTIGATAQKYGASQLASFQMSADSIKALMPQLDNLAVAQYGVNVSSDQMISAANMLGKAYAGQTGAMTRAGIVMTSAQANLIKTGDEATKTATLVEVLQQNFGNLSEEMAKTPEGALIRVRNAIGGIKAKIGAELQPVMTTALNYAADKIPQLEGIALAVIDRLKPAFSWLTETAIPNISSAIDSTVGGIQNIVKACEPAIHRFGDAFGNAKDTITNAFSSNGGIGNAISGVLSGVLPKVIDTATGIVNALTPVVSFIGEHWGAFEPILKGVLGSFLAYKGISGVSNIFTTVGNSATKFIGAFGGISKVTTVFGGMMDLFKASGGGLKQIPTLFGSIGKGLKGISGAGSIVKGLGSAFTFLGNPIGLVVVAIGAAVAIGVVLYKNWDKIKGAAKALGNTIKNAFSGIKDKVSGTWNSVKEKTSAVWDGIKDSLSDKLSGIKDKFSEAFSGAIDFVKKSYNEGALKPIVDKVTNAFGTLKDKIGEKLAPVKEVMGKAFEGAKNIVAGKLNNIKTAYEEHGGGLKGAAAAAMTAVKEYYKTGYDAINALTGGRLGKVVDTVKQKLAPVISIISTAFNGVKSAVMPIITAVKDYVVNTFNNIRSTIGNIISGIKGNFETFANSIKNAFEGVKNGIATIIEGVKTIVMGAFQVIVGIFTLNIDTIKNGVQTIKDGFSTAFEGAKQIVLNVWNAIKSYAQLAFDNVRTVVTNAITGVKTQIENVRTTVSTVFNSVKTTISNTFDSIKTKVTNVFETVKTTVKNAIDKIKGMFNFTWSLPKIKLPHFSISPAGWKIGDLLKGSIPKLNIEWYANGGIMTRPTLFGMNGNNAMVGGEAGPEAVLPLAQFWNNLERFIDRSTQNSGRPNITNTVYVTVEGGNMEDESLANTVAKRIIDVLENM